MKKRIFAILALLAMTLLFATPVYAAEQPTDERITLAEIQGEWDLTLQIGNISSPYVDQLEDWLYDAFGDLSEGVIEKHYDENTVITLPYTAYIAQRGYNGVQLELVGDGFDYIYQGSYRNNALNVHMYKSIPIGDEDDGAIDLEMNPLVLEFHRKPGMVVCEGTYEMHNAMLVSEIAYTGERTSDYVPAVEPLTPWESFLSSLFSTLDGVDDGTVTTAGIIGLVGLLISSGAAGAVASGVVGGSAGGGFPGGFNPSNLIEDLGPYIKRDADGDLVVRDPATGEKRIYVSNGDGTYSNPLTDATYTPEGLKSDLESIASRAHLIRQDQQVGRNAVDQQRADNQNLSWEAQEAARDNARMNEQFAQEDRRNNMFYKRGIYDGNVKDFKKTIIRDQSDAYQQGAYYGGKADYANAGYQTAQTVQKTADSALNVMATYEPTGVGKVINDAYAAGKAVAGNAAEVATGQKTIAQGMADAVVDTAADITKNHAPDGVGKYVTYSTMEGGKAAYKGFIDGKDADEVLNDTISGIAKGTSEAFVDTTIGKSDPALGEILKSTPNDE